MARMAVSQTTRITSYNVCYTKLLRTAGQYQIVLGNELVKGVYEQMALLVKQPVSGEKRDYSRLKQVAKTLLGKG